VTKALIQQWLDKQRAETRRLQDMIDNRREAEQAFLAQIGTLVARLTPADTVGTERVVVWVTGTTGQRHPYSPVAVLQLLVDGLPVRVQKDHLVATPAVKRQLKAAIKKGGKKR
jgi:hypothetical protein